MSEEQRKEFEKYAASYEGYAMFFVIAVILVAITCVIFYYQGFGSLVGYICCVVSLIILFVIFPLCKNKGKNEINKKFEEIERQGGISYLYADFEHGERVFNDTLRIGENFLIGKKTGTIIRYNEIIRIYKYVHKTNGIKDQQMMKVVTTDNKTHDLCILNPWKSDKAEEARVINHILSKNPAVQVGYNQ